MRDDAVTRKTETVELFSSLASGFDSGGVFAHFGQRLVDVVGVESGQRVLDVACGRGAVLFPAAERVGIAGDAVGVDLAEGMVQAANEEAERRGLDTRASVMDAERLDFADAAFDRVLCGFGIMFFPHLDQALGEFRRVLKPGGRLGVSTWQVTPSDDLRAVLVELGLLGESNDQRPPSWITESNILSRALVSAGFTDVQVDVDSLTLVFADVEQYWQSISGLITRRFVDTLAGAQIELARSALTERFRAYEQPDGIHVTATALLAVGNR